MVSVIARLVLNESRLSPRRINPNHPLAYANDSHSPRNSILLHLLRARIELRAINLGSVRCQLLKYGDALSGWASLLFYGSVSLFFFSAELSVLLCHFRMDPFEKASRDVERRLKVLS